MNRHRIMDHARLLALLVLLAVTVVGVYKFATGDWSDVIAYWGDHLAVIPLLVAFAILDVILESAYGRDASMPMPALQQSA